MTIYYVAKNGSNLAAGGETSPWASINYALRANLQPGDEIVVRAGTYNESVLVRVDGAANNYITVRSEVPGGAKIVPPAGEPGININANYVTVAGFDVSGSTESGITGVGDHHVTVAHNIVHDNVSNGIFLAEGDYFKVENNTVYGNSAKGASSGIHIKAAYNITGDMSDTNRVIIRNNIAYENETKYGPTTDGNGISIDDFRNTQIPELPPYTFRTLVEGNITYSNSGRGVQIAWSDYVTIRDNIAFHNSTLPISGPWRGDLANMGSNHTAWIGNTAVVDLSESPGNTAIANVSFPDDPKNVGVTWTGNMTFNGTPGSASVYSNTGNNRPQAPANQLGVDPGLSFEELAQMGEDLLQWTYPDPPAVTPDPDPLPGVVLNGTPASDVLTGGTSDDTLNGFDGADTLNGDDGNDLIVGGNGADTATGGAGNDTFLYRIVSHASVGEVITDFADGDVIDISGIDAKPSVEGNQQFTFIGSNAFNARSGELRYADGVLSGDVNGDGQADFQIAIANGYALDADDIIGAGGNGDPVIPPIVGKVLNGTAGNDVLTGNIADDTLNGFEGLDTLDGSDGNDLLVGGSGADSATGGAGNDTFVYRAALHASAGDVITDFAEGDLIDISDIDAKPSVAGNQQFTFIGSNAFYGRSGELRYADGVVSGDVNGDGQADFQIAIGNSYALDADDIIGAGGNGDPVIPPIVGKVLNGTAGNDVLTGNIADDTLNGFEGLDTLNGSDGNDLLVGGSGADSATGGAGNDTFVYRSAVQASAGDVITDFAEGDLIDISNIDAKPSVAGNQQFTFIGSNAFYGRSGELRYADGVLSGDVNGDGQTDFQIAIANGYALDADDIIGAGGNGDPVVPPIVGKVLNGTAGNDVLTGNIADDTLNGFEGLDTLDGSDGNDLLVGGGGADSATGGAGNDTFVYRSALHASAGDVITDFAEGDLIDISDIDAKPSVTGNQQFTFIGSNAFYGRSGELRYADSVLSGDVNGDGQADFQIAIGNGYALDASDIIGAGGNGDPVTPPVVGVVLNGTAGNDVLTGDIADDTLNGAAGADNLSGMEGNDVLFGGNGVDSAGGGDGNDTFLYRHASNATGGDVIRDFAAGDIIDLHEVDAKSRTDGDQDFTFIGDANFSKSSGELQYRNGMLHGDFNGDGLSDFRIEIANGYALTAADFIL